MRDAPLFDKTLVRKTDPQTSKDAARKIVESGALNRQEDEVWRMLKGFDCDEGLTMRELSELSGLDYFMCQRRISGIFRKNKAKIVGEKDGMRLWRAIKNS